MNVLTQVDLTADKAKMLMTAGLNVNVLTQVELIADKVSLLINVSCMPMY